METSNHKSLNFNNLVEVTMHFSDKQVCKDYLKSIRWNGNVTCPHCNHAKCYTMKKNYKCSKCRKQFSEIKGTIFENSPIALQKWFVAIWLFTSHKKGIASTQLAKDIGVTQKSAWFMLQRIRYAMETKSFNKMSGVVQADESYFGGSNANMHSQKRKDNNQKPLKGKTPVIGVYSDGKVNAIKTKDNSKASIDTVLLQNVKQDSILVTDNYAGYKGAGKYFKRREVVSHTRGEYVNKRGFNTNGIENFWSHLKRGIYGIYP